MTCTNCRIRFVVRGCDRCQTCYSEEAAQNQFRSQHLTPFHQSLGLDFEFKQQEPRYQPLLCTNCNRYPRSHGGNLCHGCHTCYLNQQQIRLPVQIPVQMPVQIPVHIPVVQSHSPQYKPFCGRCGSNKNRKQFCGNCGGQ
jgi:hypothetical protein